MQLAARSAVSLTPPRRRRGLSDAAKRRDPTRSNDLRRRIATDMRQGLALWRRQVYAAIVAADQLGYAYGDVDLNDAEVLIDRLDALLHRQAEFAFAAAADGMDANLRTAYGRGIARAGEELTPVLPSDQSIGELALAARADLEDMLDDQIDKFTERVRDDDTSAIASRYKLYSALLLPALLLPMAKRLNSLSTTSVTQAFNAGKIDTYAELGIDAVGVTPETQPQTTEELLRHLAEHGATEAAGEQPAASEEAYFPGSYTVETVGDDKVCAICESYEGNAYTLDEARDLIPAHPNCRCAIVPLLT